MKHQMIINEDGTDHVYECANGFVSRCVAAVHAENFADARRVCEILNAHAAKADATKEACAKIAEDYDGDGMNGGMDCHLGDAFQTRREIAELIRNTEAA